MIEKNILSRDEDGVIHLVKHIKIPVFEMIKALKNKSSYDITFRYEAG